jgi:hypothetical protein
MFGARLLVAFQLEPSRLDAAIQQTTRGAPPGRPISASAESARRPTPSHLERRNDLNGSAPPAELIDVPARPRDIRCHDPAVAEDDGAGVVADDGDVLHGCRIAAHPRIAGEHQQRDGTLARGEVAARSGLGKARFGSEEKCPCTHPCNGDDRGCRSRARNSHPPRSGERR